MSGGARSLGPGQKPWCTHTNKAKARGRRRVFKRSYQKGQRALLKRALEVTV